MYIEQHCTINHEGREFTAFGAVVTPHYLVAYPADNGVLHNWAGKQIGTYTVVSSRPAIFFGRHSWQGSRYYYMRAKVDGKQYAIRGFGPGMIAKGKAIKG